MASTIPTGLSTVVNGNEVVFNWTPTSLDQDGLYLEESRVRLSRFADFRDELYWEKNSEDRSYEDYEGTAVRDIFDENDNGPGYVKSLDKGTYYWQVENIVYNGETDTYHQKGWSEVKSFTVTTNNIEADYENITIRKDEWGNATSIWDERGKNITVNNGGILTAEHSIIVNSTINDGGIVGVRGGADHSRNAAAIGTTINSGGYLQVQRSFVADTVIHSGGTMIIQGSALNYLADYCSDMHFNLPEIVRVPHSGAFDTTVAGQLTANGAELLRTTINAGGKMTAYGSNIETATINTGGRIDLYQYAAERELAYGEGAPATIRSDRLPGVATDVAVKGGALHLHENTTGSNIRVSDRGIAYVYAGAKITKATVSVNGSLFVFGGGEAENITIDGGMVHVATGGSVSGVTVKSGSLYLYGGAILNGKINISGTMVLDDVAMNFGRINLAVTAAAESAPMINNLSLLGGDGELSVTLAANQALGSYRLAGSAAGYSGSLSVVSGANTLGTLAIGDYLNSNGLRYSLVLSKDSELQLQIAQILPPAAPSLTITPDTDTNGNVTVTAHFADGIAVREYSLNGGEWLSYTTAVVMTDNGSIRFRAGDGYDNYSAIVSREITNIDRIAPTAPVITASNTKPVYGSITVSAVFAADSVKNEYSFDNKSWSVYNKAITVSNNGTLYFRSADAAGNSSQASYKVANILTVDPLAPSAVSLEKSKLQKYNISLKWNKAVTSDKKTKVAYYEISINGKVVQHKSTSYTLKDADLGKYACSVRAVDSEGRAGKWSAEAAFSVVDITPPTVKLQQAAVNGYELNLAWTGADKKGSITSYTVKYDGTVRAVLPGSATSTRLMLTEADVGKHKIEVIATDGVNTSKAASKSITVKDATPPSTVAGLTSPDVRSKDYKTVLSWSAAADNSGLPCKYEIMLDGKLYKSSKLELKTAKLDVGDHTWQVRAIDKAKNKGDWSALRSFNVFDVTPPAKVSAKAAVSGNSAAISWKAAKDNVGVAGYEIWGGTNLETFQRQTTVAADQLSYDFGKLNPGNWFYGVVAIDAAGNRSDLKAAKLAVKEELTASERSALSSAQLA